MSDFWITGKSYFLWRRYIDWCTRRCFSSIEIEGTLPSMESGAWFMAANHTNTLMDALVLLQCRKEPTSFGARADVFRNPTVAGFLHFCKVLPLARKDRENPEEVAHNRETMMYIDDVVAHGIPFCMFPEGRHRPKHSLLPLRRGIASMSFRSAGQRPTYILPVGLDYSDWFHFRSRVRIRFGEPLDVNAFAGTLPPDLDSGHRDRALQEELYRRMSALIFYIPDDDNYEEALAAASALQPRHRLRDILLSVLSFPLFAVSAVLSLPMWASAEVICSRMKDKAWSNTVRFAVRLLLWPLMALVWLIAGLCTLPWWGALLLVLAFLPSYSFFYSWLNLARGAK